MDIETHRIPRDVVDPGNECLSIDPESDSAPGTLLFKNRYRMICMPSSRAIAEAIIRRTVFELRH